MAFELGLEGYMDIYEAEKRVRWDENDISMARVSLS